MLDLSTVTHQTFEPLIDEPFEILIEGSEDAASLTLIEVTPKEDDQPAGDQRRSFSLLFAGPAEPELAQQTVTLEHDRLGTAELFLVPIGRDERGMLYEAVFN